MPLLELRLKLLAGFKKAVDLRYLGIHQPQVNLIVFPDGTTNIPQPKAPQTTERKIGTRNVVDLAVGSLKSTMVCSNTRDKKVRLTRAAKISCAFELQSFKPRLS